MIDIKNIENFVQAYITKNFKEPIRVPIVTLTFAMGRPIRIVKNDPDEIDFIKLRAQELSETFPKCFCASSKKAVKKILQFILAPTLTADIFPR